MAQVDDLTETVRVLTKSIETLKREIADMQFQMKRAGEDREPENKDFQGVIADQRATQDLLGKALGILKGFDGLQVEKKQPLSAAAAAPWAPLRQWCLSSPHPLQAP